MPSFAGARAKLATATQDLFRLSGHYSIPVEPPAPEPPPPIEPAIDSNGRKAESSMMFSLEALMKANAPTSKRDAGGEVSDQLWNMQAATPLFGTAQDQALLTTPLKVEPSPSMDSMTLPSHSPSGRRWWPLAIAAGAGLALAAGGVWFFRTPHGAAPAVAAVPSEQTTLAAQPPAALPPPVDEPTPQGAPPAQPATAEPGAVPPAAEATGASEAVAPTEAAGAVAPAEAVAAAGEPSTASAGAVKPDAPRSTRKPPPRAVTPSPKAAAFDKGAAKTALNTATALAADCGQGGAPGKGKIQVTFAPSGKVSDAALVEGPFAGTAAGKCALRHFRSVRVPAFAGAPVTVAKSFKID